MNKDSQLIWEAYLTEGTADVAIQWLGKIREKGYRLIGHQTYESIAAEIVKNRKGFDGGPNLGGTAVGMDLHTITDTIIAQQEVALGQEQKAAAQVHRGSDGLLIMVIPEKFKDGRKWRYLDDISYELLEQTHNTVLPDNYIAGYFDSKSKSLNFFRNGRFDPTVGPLSGPYLKSLTKS